ncbi:MAG: ADP-ribosylglycohydrolase family protein [Gemmatimonadales bacterium]|nr:ADP-ribosylglycohydrolase family protein [Gemmatimonadales bacterium]MDZ4388673.1 ADP-ribosylglycohydrolase family protein [Gemmatimonadales bacterium]
MTTTPLMETVRLPSPLADPGRSRRLGSILGLVVGDAVGATNEFKTRGTFTLVTDMVGGGPFDLPAGAWTDDSSMALCLAESLVETGKFDPVDQMQRYVRWWRNGYLSSTGICFDVGLTTRQALARFELTGEPFAGSTDSNSAGNGSVMRLAPVVAWAPDEETAVSLAHQSSRTTHGAAEAVDGCVLLARLLFAAYRGEDPTAPMARVGEGWSVALRTVAAMARAEGYAPPAPPTGYVVDTLACARWCAARGRNFREAVLLAANLGGDADSIAAVTGQIAGAIWGVEGIPPEWLERLAMRERVMELAERCVR